MLHKIIFSVNSYDGNRNRQPLEIHRGFVSLPGAQGILTIESITVLLWNTNGKTIQYLVYCSVMNLKMSCKTHLRW